VTSNYLGFFIAMAIAYCSRRLHYKPSSYASGLEDYTRFLLHYVQILYIVDIMVTIIVLTIGCSCDIVVIVIIVIIVDIAVMQ
jgi:hypothetical protein